ncbi:Arsenite methyltransferase [Methylacidimicrobium sp. AP8]|nr:Arsenite methyltransferase [Methylacidimicrobium sp. AP8]
MKARYAEEARRDRSDASRSASCCGKGFYRSKEAAELPAEALAASLGCANPVALAQLQVGEIVLDLGAGGGIDVLLAAGRVGPTGRAYGLDMTEEMWELARENQRKAGLDNVEFLKGEIENIPLPDNSVDVVLSNCVINLSTEKDRVFAEAFRVLKPGGRIAVADIVLLLCRNGEIWAGCLAGALEESESRTKLATAGFTDIRIEPVRSYSASDAMEFLRTVASAQLDAEALARLREGKFLSALLRARKPER